MGVTRRRDVWASARRADGGQRRRVASAQPAVAAVGPTAVTPGPSWTGGALATAARELSGGAPPPARDVALRAAAVADVPAGTLRHVEALPDGRLTGRSLPAAATPVVPAGEVTATPDRPQAASVARLSHARRSP